MVWKIPTLCSIHECASFQSLSSTCLSLKQSLPRLQAHCVCEWKGRKRRRSCLDLNICCVQCLIMDEIRRELETLKLNTAYEIETLKQNQARILTSLKLEQSAPTSQPPSTPLTLSPTPLKSSDVDPPKKRRKTVSKKYETDEQKMLLYGGTKIHLQVLSTNRKLS